MLDSASASQLLAISGGGGLWFKFAILLAGWASVSVWLSATPGRVPLIFDRPRLGDCVALSVEVAPTLPFCVSEVG